jgi:hypothetical protein
MKIKSKNKVQNLQLRNITQICFEKNFSSQVSFRKVSNIPNKQ